MISPVTYQGGKQRIAEILLGLMEPRGPFVDLCCGSEAVSITLRKWGHDPGSLTMIDAGPWGLFWEAVGSGSFSLSKFRLMLDEIPQDVTRIRDYLSDLAKSECGLGDEAYTFLILQAGAFGGKAIHWDEGSRTWGNTSFRSAWEPTTDSNRRTSVNPMMPMPKTLYERTAKICEGMNGVKAAFGRAESVVINPGSTVYVDPPYKGTEGYGNLTLDLSRLSHISMCRCFVSESVPVSDIAWRISLPRDKGGISGCNKNGRNSEWLSLVSNWSDAELRRQRNQNA